MSRRIFVSYRRDDSAGHAGRIHDRMVQSWGNDRAFFDIEHILAGRDFTVVLENALNECGLLVLIIGRRWLERTRTGTRRIDEVGDFHRFEIESALRRSVPILPVLVDGARAPAIDRLPLTIAPIAKLQGFRVSDYRFDADTRLLLVAIDEMLKEEAKRLPPIVRPSQLRPRPSPGEVIRGLAENAKLETIGLEVEDSLERGDLAKKDRLQQRVRRQRQKASKGKGSGKGKW